MYGGLSFRQLHDFNVALLGKQGWRLITNPESLVARIFKAFYFPQSNFLHAKLGSSPSFIWRSVFEAQDMIKNGLRCRVGSGNSVSILKDPWLPDARCPYITSENEALGNQMVLALMVINERRWDIELI
ncbi:putative mitochondrial protein AtMg00310 [Apium graveolens]|uniref:putative mitochondrial protein AtMg00310 n=1 Tax=Apium graveolens TaxID=4045 RepID=UPI003D7BC91A